MADSHTPDNSPLAADDPRISEWIDGRLGATEATEIERAVEASPELLELVADLRTMRRAMRVDPDDVVPTVLADRVMAAISKKDGSAEPIVASPPKAAALSGRRRPLPWLGLLGALAAGLLVTIVVNRPEERGRDVALAPREGEAVRARAQSVASKASEAIAIVSDESHKDQLLEAAATNSSDAMAAGHSAGGGRSDDSRLRGEARAADRAAVDAEVTSDDKTAREGLSGPAATASIADAVSPEEAKGLGKKLANDEQNDAVALYADAAGATAPGSVPAPKAVLVPPMPATPLPAKEAAPADTPKPQGDIGGGAFGQGAKGEESSKQRQEGKRTKVEIAGVLVIAITSPSERRALDRLVADSGLEATPDKDHIELLGPRNAVDDFLAELERVGLVAAAPARRADVQAKLKADAKANEKQTSLILRVVERKKKNPAAAQGTQPEKKP